MTWGSGEDVNLLWYQNWCKSRGKKQPKSTHTKNTRKQVKTIRPREARSCLMARCGRANVLPSRLESA